MSKHSPLYRKIAQQMKEEISKGEWKEGNAIPTELMLSETYQASRVTVRQAIKVLVQQGLLYKIQGSGTYVSEHKYEHNIYELTGFTEEMRALNKNIINKVLTFSVIEPEERIVQALGLEEAEKVYYIRRQRWADDIPLIVEDTYLPLALFPDLTYQIMEGSKYDFIESVKKLKIKDSYQEVIPILPTEEIQELLQLKEQIPIIKVQLLSTLKDDRVFEYTDLFFKSDEYKFTITANRS
ncbi:GntR family transcriptional regulator [Alkalicoccobacillus murimartini]|uniref:GntR family mannosyl-D-glycerate transport/metabolism transcriptional repressor n=1 Tax=Alkalicoccobacillus murimartini TaxID=171685 RepID=A0ABT9YKZ4_9BACI|nr:UTRA domain-containing protein [Alkalicoccobacillus murimartini]MDQ0208523.1 GntR family mannosyl-D-glycerate transport/metabolism transcriptional repressor [Alkalicoccobacillus murimartini]